MSVKLRIAALERRAERSAPVRACPECGGGGNGQRNFIVRVREPGEQPEPEFCPRCKRQTTFVVDFDKGG